jgi:hypothetical protein
MSALSATAITLMLNDQYYRYDQGIYYSPYDNGYRVVPAPAGVFIRYLPNGYSTIYLGDYTYYYFAGTFYYEGANGYSVIAPPPGAVVYDLPEGTTETKIGDIVYLVYNNTFYQPIQLDGRNGYEVVQLESDTY